MSTVKRIPDNQWSLSKAMLKAQSKSIVNATMELDIHGLTNSDKFSDYVNATLQSLFNFENLRRVLLETKKTSIIKRMFQIYRSKQR